jgi:three-Cys-motif partner protein
LKEGKMDNRHFFHEQKVQSQIKAEIVAKYFNAWANIMASRVAKYGGKIAYLDLFAGPGRYKDGSKSTPILILEQAIKNKKIAPVFISLFNDVSEENTKALQEEIDSLEEVATLRYQPEVHNTIVDAEIVKLIGRVQPAPTLLFADPWGYKGLSLQLIHSVLKNWGCDCIFFFNYNRINMGLSNPYVEEHMVALFGKQRASTLRQRLEQLDPQEREQTIVDEFTSALEEIGGTFVLPFTFKNDRRARTSHYLVFVCKHQLGYTIMKEIMHRASSNIVEGVASFEYNPAEIHAQAFQPLLPLFAEEFHPLNGLENALLHDFAGRCVTAKQAFQEHHVGKRFIEKNYREAFRNLEARGEIVADTPADKRKKRKGQVVIKGVSFTFPSGPKNPS